MSGDPKAKFKKYVGAESGGGRPKGKGFITELQRQKLKPAHLDVIVEKNKARNHYPRRVSDEKWAKVKVELKRKQYDTKHVAGNNQKLKTKAPVKKKKPNMATPSNDLPRRPSRNKKKP